MLNLLVLAQGAEGAEALTEQKRLVEASRTADLRLRDAIEAISEAFVLWDVQNRLVMCNSNFQELHNLPDEAITVGASYESVVAAGSDWSVTSMNPLLGIQVGITRRPLDGSLPAWIPEERASLADMIAAYTINGAYLMRQEGETGSIEVGKAAA